MPGITGIISSISHEQNCSDLQLMLATMKHEEYYQTGTYVNRNLGIYVGWVCHKDSVVDCMPIFNESMDKCLFLYGEEFSKQSVIKKLSQEGHQFSHDDNSYLIHLFEELGEDWFGELNGFYHGILLDISRGELCLFNDRYGMQRLYYHECPTGLLFSSEAKALLRVRHELREILPNSLGQLISMGCVLNDNTLFKKIYHLPGAALWKYKNGKCLQKERYFDRRHWENQEPLEGAVFYDELKRAFIKLLPNYLDSSRQVGMSLTGGLDTRMIMAHAHKFPGSFPCYTFGSMYHDSFDVKVARKIASLCNQKHTTIRIDNEFLKGFSALARKVVYISDGYLDVSGATELFVNSRAREIAPIRITGNYGSEVLRSIRAFKPRSRNSEIFDAEFTGNINDAIATYEAAVQGHPLTFSVFKQAPWFNYNRLCVEQSQLTMRTPFMDNELIALVYRAPYETLISDDISLSLVKDGNRELSKVITNRGVGDKSSNIISKTRQILFDALRRAEMGYDYCMPQWLCPLDHWLTHLHLEHVFLGWNKFYHFRIWYRDQLSSYVKEVLLDPSSLRRPHINKRVVERMINRHIKGDRNYTTEIEKLLSIELIYRHVLKPS
jgi:asparagine synthase (glutamine-hydrolysing)